MPSVHLVWELSHENEGKGIRIHLNHEEQGGGHLEEQGVVDHEIVGYLSGREEEGRRHLEEEERTQQEEQGLSQINWTNKNCLSLGEEEGHPCFLCRASLSCWAGKEYRIFGRLIWQKEGTPCCTSRWTDKL